MQHEINHINGHCKVKEQVVICNVLLLWQTKTSSYLVLNSQRIFGTCHHSTKCKKVKDEESLAKTCSCIIIDKYISGNRDNKKIDGLSKHLNIQNFSEGSKITFQMAIQSFGVESWCILTKQTLLYTKELLDLVCVLYLYM